AHTRWHDWVELEPALDIGVELLDLDTWSWTRDPRTDDVLRALARLGSPRGHDEPLAATILAWLLSPGAASIARQALSPADSGGADELTASALWVACREAEWEKPAPVAPCVLRIVRRAVQAELGFGEGCKRADRAWAFANPWDPQWGAWEIVIDPHQPSPSTAASELLELLDDAVRSEVITPSDLELLVDIAIATDELELHEGAPARRQACGLGSRAAATVVANRLGLHEVTIRRRLRRCLHDLTEFAAGALHEQAAA
ncbi:hypothetical protein, partial [Aeromicrobium alkaliterrae]|uniref:hypothetical protein n=1 Tax=Aeromicrobium alkaliterrae TaxID=302168 RepID=UPI0031CE91A3